MHRGKDAGQAEKIIVRALKTLGMPYCELKAKAHLPHPRAEDLRLETLTATQWIRICDALSLPSRALVDGYDRERHQALRRYYETRGYPEP